MNHENGHTGASTTHGAKLDSVGLIILVVGLTLAGLVYGLGQERSRARTISTADGTWKDGSLALEDSKVASRDIEMYYGKAGLVMVRLQQTLQRPETVAAIIASASLVAGLGCFFVARRR